jgi:YidC/Oxa1 family membrane protein insertase
MQPMRPMPPNNKHSAEDNRNLILATVLSLGLFFVWQYFFIEPQQEAARQAGEAQRAAEQQRQQNTLEQAALGDSTVGPFGGQAMDRDAAIAASGDRISLATPTLNGSISLSGGLIDELFLTTFRTRLEKDSDPIELLWPAGAPNAYYPVFGWVAGGGVAGPTRGTPWALAPGSASTLTPETPITLIWDNETGQRFVREIAVDDQYMFTITQRLENKASTAVLVKPYAAIQRHGDLELRNRLSGTDDAQAIAGTGWLIHQGPIAAMDGRLEEPEFEDIAAGGDRLSTGGVGIRYNVNAVGWLGFTDKYWMTALAPVGKAQFEQFFETGSDARQQPLYRATLDRGQKQIGPGASYAVKTRFFAGVKQVRTLRHYEYMLDGVDAPRSVFGRVSDFLFKSSESRFLDAIDWGWFFFLTKPISEGLLAIQAAVGNMGVAIILLTLIFKTLLFPLAYKSFVSMSKLKKLQPQMQEIRERTQDDRMAMQQEMMALYKREKVNPAAGCLPILLQIPIFFSLYKVLFISIELRHAPFFGWVQDLSAPDPTSIFNLFGLLPYDVPSILLIGVWPLLMGISMWIQQMLNPAPTDPIQEKIFAMLPIIFTFLLAGFASGLVIYWCANNIFTIIQQYTIMRSQGVDINILDNMRRQLGLKRDKSSG